MCGLATTPGSGRPEAMRPNCRSWRIAQHPIDTAPGNAELLGRCRRTDQPGHALYLVGINRSWAGRPRRAKTYGKKREHGSDSGDSALERGKYVPVPSRTACLLHAIMAYK